jgi:hypothetical protein
MILLRTFITLDKDNIQKTIKTKNANVANAFEIIARDNNLLLHWSDEKDPN